MDFSIKVIDDAGAAKTGGAASTTIKVKRNADDFFLDFNSLPDFSATPTTLTAAMTETEATRWAGGYEKTIDISSFDDGYYDLEAKYDDGSLVRNFIKTIFVNGGLEFQEAVARNDVFPKNVAKSNFEFFMVGTADHVTGATGLIVTVQRSIDGGAFADSTNTPSTEVGQGIYKIDFSAADLNGDVITFKCTAASADTRMITIITQS